MIRVEPTEKHNRTVLFTNLPVGHKNDPAQVEVCINYTEEKNEGGRLYKAIALDSHVMPAIYNAFEAVRQLDALATQLKGAGMIVPPGVAAVLKKANGTDWRKS